MANKKLIPEEINKICKKCKLEKSITEFYKNNKHNEGRRSSCKECTAVYRRKYMKHYRKIHKKKLSEYNKEYCKKYYKKNKKRMNKQSREWGQKNRIKINERTKRKKDSDIQYRLAYLLRNRLNIAIKRKYKSGSAVRDLGCSIKELKLHLESQFYPHPETGEMMTWDNYGIFGWHIDHILPLSGFNLEDREHLLVAVNVTNLQPLWAEENYAKGGI